MPAPSPALRCLLLLVVAVSCACGAAPPRALVMRDVSFPLRDMRFPSGLRVVIEEDHRTPLVAVFSLVGSGSTSDPQGKAGLAHYVEHLTFRSRPDGEHSLRHLAERAGAGVWNAGTSWDYTIYHEVGPRDALAQLVLLEGVRLLAPVTHIPPEVAAVELEVVRNELRQRNETGRSGAVLGWASEALFPADHPYARPPIGTHESLSGLTLADAQRFAKEHYRPDNTTIVIVGDVDLQTVGRIVEESLPPALRALPAGAPPFATAARLDPVAPPPPEPPPGAMARREGDVATPEVWIGWTLPRSFDAEGYLDDFVKRAAQAALVQSWRDDGDIAGVTVSLVGGTRAAMLLCGVILRDGAAPERSADHVMNRLLEIWDWDAQAIADQRDRGSVPPPGQLLARRRPSPGRVATYAREERSFVYRQRSVVTAMMLDAENLVSQGEDRAELTHFSGDPTLFSRGLRAVMSTDAARVSAFAHQYVTRERARVLLVMPPPGDAEPPPDEGRAAFAPVDEAPPAFDADAIRKFVRPPGVRKYRRVVLDNGLEVVIGRRAGLPVVTVGLSLHGGAAVASPPGANEIATRYGRAKVTSKATAAEFGGHRREEDLRDQWVWQIQGSAGNVENMLSLVSDWAPAMRVEPEALAFLRTELVPIFEKIEAAPARRGQRAFWQALYGDHPYGRTPVIADLARVEASDADAWVTRVTVPRNAVLAVVGEVDPDEVAAMVTSTFGRWSSAAPAEAPPPPPALPTPRAPVLQVAHRPGATQAEVRVGCLLPPAGASTARYAMMASLVQDRLFTTLRQTLGATYGVGARAGTFRGGAAHLAVTGAIDNANLPRALTTLRKTLDALAHEKLAPAELDAARWRAAREYGVHYQSNASIVQAILAARNQERDLGSIDAFPEALIAVTPAELQADLARCTAAPVVSIVGDEVSARGAFAAAWAP